MSPRQQPRGITELRASIAELRERLAGLEETALGAAFQAGYARAQWEAAAAERDSLQETVEVLSDPEALVELQEVRAARERGDAPTPLPEVLDELYRRAETERGPEEAKRRWAQLGRAVQDARPRE